MNVEEGNVFLLHDNARSHTANTVKALSNLFGWDILNNFAYSSDSAFSDFHLFISFWRLTWKRKNV